jgi:NAD(P)-dependent dehydrogenase (short-subunit alcohol dehydrogenase family)
MTQSPHPCDLDAHAFADRTALVTGGTDGLGEHLVRTLVDMGARVFFCGRRRDVGEALAADLGPRAVFVQCDLAHMDQLRHFADRVAQQTDQLDYLVNNAAIDPRIDFVDATPADFDRLIAVNLGLSRQPSAAMSASAAFGLVLSIPAASLVLFVMAAKLPTDYKQHTFSKIRSIARAGALVERGANKDQPEGDQPTAAEFQRTSTEPKLASPMIRCRSRGDSVRWIRPPGGIRSCAVPLAISIAS